MDKKHADISAFRNGRSQVGCIFRKVKYRMLTRDRMSFQLCHMIHERATQDSIPHDIHFGSSPPQDTAPTHDHPDEHNVDDRTPSTVIEGDLDRDVAASAVERAAPSPVAEPPAEEESTWLGPVEGTQGSAQSVAAVKMRSGLEHLVSHITFVAALLLIDEIGSSREGRFL